MSLSSAVNGGVELEFGEAVVLDQSIRPVPVGDFEAEASFNSFYLATSDNYVLLLVGTPWKGVWSMVRTTREGDLIDTIPRQMRSPSDNLAHTLYRLTWSSPYFYLWEINDAEIFITRLTEDLTLIDNLPRQATSFAGKRLINAGGSQIWMMDDYRHVWGYDAVLDSTFVDGVRIDGWRGVTGVATRGVVSEGLYVARRNPIDVVTDLAYVSERGEVRVLAPAVYDNTMFEASPHSNDSVVFWKVFNSSDTSPARLQYCFASRSDSLAARDLHDVDISGFVSNTRPECFTSLGETGFLAGATHVDDYRWFAMSIDFATDSIIAFKYFGPRSRYANVITALSRFGNSVSVFCTLNDGIERTELSGADLTTTNGPSPVLYGLGYQSSPSMMKDSTGLLIYLSEGTDLGATIAGYRVSNPIVDNFAKPLRIGTPFPESTLVRPHIIQEDQARGLFWVERLPDDTAGFQSHYYYKKLALFQGDSPDPAQVQDAHVLNTIHKLSIPNDHPRTVKIRDTLYIRSGVVQSIDLINNQLTGLFRSAISEHSAMMLGRADTLTFLGIGLSCTEYCGNLGCCVWKRYLLTKDYVQDVRVSNYNGGWLVGDERDYPDYDQILQGAFIDGHYFLALADPPSIQEVDFVSRTSAPVVDLAPLLAATPNYYRARPRALVVPYQGYSIVFYFRYDLEPQEVFVFDSNWNLVTQQEIPVAGAMQEIAGIEFTSDPSTMVLVYSSFLPFPYSSERCVLQTISIDVATDIAEDPIRPDRFKVSQNYPNPFNPETVIEYHLPRRSQITLMIFNVLGQRVRTLVDREEPAGSYVVTWDGDDKDGEPSASGVYLYRLQAGSYSETKKMLLLR